MWVLPSRPTTSFAVSVGKAPHGEVRLLQAKAIIAATRSESIYELNCGVFALGDVLFDSSAIYDSPECSLRGRNPSGRRLIQGLRWLTSRWTLTFWCLSSTATTPTSRPPFMRGVHGGVLQMPTSGVQLTLAVWGGAVSDCHFYTLPAPTASLSTDTDWTYVLQVHRGVALSRSPQEHVCEQTTHSRVDPDPRISLPQGVVGVSIRCFDLRRPLRFAALLWPTRNLWF